MDSIRCVNSGFYFKYSYKHLKIIYLLFRLKSLFGVPEHYKEKIKRNEGGFKLSAAVADSSRVSHHGEIIITILTRSYLQNPSDRSPKKFKALS